MQTQQRKDGLKPKKAPRWRDLTDEQQWEQIYAGRERRKAVAPRSVAQAVALGLPGYVMHMAVSDCHATFQATVRHDVHVAIVSSMAKVASLLPTEKARGAMADRMHKHYLDIKGKGFYLHNREFLYANSAALVKMVDDYRYPPDAPAAMAALMLKEDAETDEAGDWSLDRRHCLKMVEVAFDQYLDTGLYVYPDAKLG